MASLTRGLLLRTVSSSRTGGAFKLARVQQQPHPLARASTPIVATAPVRWFASDGDDSLSRTSTKVAVRTRAGSHGVGFLGSSLLVACGLTLGRAPSRV